MTGIALPYLSAGQVSFKVTPEILTEYWIGEAGEMHRNMYRDLEDDIEEILKRLGEHPVDLVAIAQKYSDVELKIQQEIQELPGDIIL